MQTEPLDDPYRVLGLPRSATLDELKRAYRKLSMTWHPDRHTGGSDADRRAAELRFKQINSAYVTIGELLREPRAGSAQPATARAEADAVVESDSRIAAIQAVVASVALRVVPSLPRYAYRRVIAVVEQLLFETIAIGDRAFVGGFSTMMREAMLLVGMDNSLRADALKVLDATVDELEWRGYGAGPEVWQQLLQPLTRARDPQSAPPRPLAPAGIDQRPQWIRIEDLLRQEPALVVCQGALAFIVLLLLLPILPVAGAWRFLLLLLDLAALGGITFAPRGT